MTEPALWSILPFLVLLLAMALLPFIHRHHWENHYPKIAIGLGALTTSYYIFALHNPGRMVVTAIDYLGFIALIGALYIIAGGIHINLTGHATPTLNVTLLAVGAVLANFIGTTGASMLLIRPFLKINKDRVAPYHVVFFIFIVSNIGGALTPIGDPPLFLGYLKGVPFFWLVTSPPIVFAWLLAIGLLLGVFFVIDRRDDRSQNRGVGPAPAPRVKLTGTPNFIWLAAIIGLVLAQKADWLHSIGHGHAVTVGIAGAMLAVAAVAHRWSSPTILQQNDFTFAPLREVAFLFAGIFATMVPALDLLEKHAGDIGITTVPQFYWGTGLLSSVLDNAPTYLNFLTAAFGLHQLSPDVPADMARMLSEPALARYLIAISIGAVFFGAVTYIGNGPNFMVKSIAESSGVRCPSFFGYIGKYALPILLPILILVGWLFLR